MKARVVLLLCFCFLLCGNLSGFAQWKVVYNELALQKSYYDIAEDDECKKLAVGDFPLTRLFEYEDAYLLINRNRSSKKTSGPRSFKKGFSDAINIKSDTTCLRLSLYTEGVIHYSLRIHESTSKTWFEKSIECSGDGYQASQFFPLSDIFGECLAEGAVTIDSLAIVCDSVVKSPEVVAFELLVADHVNTENRCRHPFVESVLSSSDYELPVDVFGPLAILKGHSGRFLVESEETIEMGYMSNYFSFVRDTSLANEKPESEIEILKRIMVQAIERYPFYEERNLNPDSLRNRWAGFVAQYDDNGDILAFGRDLSAFIYNEFKDPHFLLEVPTDGTSYGKKNGPVRLYPIRGDIIVAAVFREDYKSIPLGSKVIAIDGMPVDSLVEVSKGAQLGVPERQYMRAVANLLAREPNDTVLLTYHNRVSGILEVAKLTYNGKLNIPVNFQPSHGRFQVRDSVAYFGINRMDQNIYRMFVNKLDEINKSKALIFDLRGNPGGSSYFGEKVFSFFIDKPTVFSHQIPIGDSYRRQSRVVAPDSEVHFAENFPVVIIGDENTACASEDFIQAMKKLPRCYYISHSKTSGALQNRYGISFPSGIFLSLDCLTGKIYADGIGVVETKGIEPDIWIQPSCVEDLAPYNDLLKETAFKIASAKFW